MIVISAGVVMNVLLAAGLFILVFKLGLKTEPPRVGFVVPDSPAAKAGLLPGDTIVSIDGEKPDSFNDLVLTSAMAHKGRALAS